MSLPLPRGRGLTAALAAVVVMTAVGPAAADVAPASSPGTTISSTASASGRSAASRTVTLITGDKVTVAEDGRTATAVVDPQGRASGVHVMSVGDDTYVYPDQALPYISSGALDEQLFNVTELVEDGYDAAHSDRLPLLVTYNDAARFRTATVPDGARKTLTLDSIQGAAISAGHADAAGFWSSLTGTSPGARRSTQADGRDGALAGGIAKVWLDGKAEVSLSDTTSYIGAPEVWGNGNTGRGVDVAVLDTGIDAAHPDFADRIAVTQSFVPGEDTSDHAGHGTHVASTIAGTGAASGGTEKGVASGASLHIGKVLGNDGKGQDSWILAGMEWAARDQHARIINMSLGVDNGGDGTDPLSQAVNRLSAETGALFVVAAGNSGPDAYTLGSPGVADAALTVAAVASSGKQADQLAGFSSRGPRQGDHGLKPDLSAPGVAVLAARSQYMAGGEGPYLSMSGTSMATPHVAGAAALLAAEHPDWTGQQLKDALVSTAKGASRYSPYEAGSGRLDIAATAKATLITPASVFADARYPYTAGQTVRKDVTYTNTGAAPVTVDLTITGGTSSEGQQLPEDLFTLTASRLTVPAHGTATVGVISHLDKAENETGYSSLLTATGQDGTAYTHTPIGLNKEGPRHTLSFSAKDRRGKPLSGTLILQDITRNVVPRIHTLDGAAGVSDGVLPGTYAAWLYADVPGVDGTHSRGMAVFSAPQITVDRDRTVVFDAATLRKAEATTPQRTANSFLRVDQYRSYGDLAPYADSYQPVWWLYDSLWLAPTPKVTLGHYTAATRWRQVQPPLTLSSGSQSYDSLVIQSQSPILPEGTLTYPAVYAGDGSAADFGKQRLRGKAAVVRRSDSVPAPDQAAAAKKAGASTLLILNDGYGPLDAWAERGDAPPLPVASLGTDDSVRLLSRIRLHEAPLKFVSHPYARYLYDLIRYHKGAVAQDPSYHPRANALARIDESFRHTQQVQALEMRQDMSLDHRTLTGADSRVRAQGTLTSWVTAGPNVEWTNNASTNQLGNPGSLALWGDARSYKPGSVFKETWFSPVLHPRLLDHTGGIPAPYRSGNILSSSILTPWGDAGGHAGLLFSDGGTSKTSLYQGDQLLDEVDNEHIINVPDVSPEPTPYRLVVEGRQDMPQLAYSTRTRTEWGFRSGYENDDYATLPLIQVGYSVPTDLSGKAPRQATLTVTPSHLPSATGAGAIRTTTVDVSYDDGATWHRTPLSHKGSAWSAKLGAPSKARYVSLRTTVRDAKGNSVSQTLVRAFGLT